MKKATLIAILSVVCGTANLSAAGPGIAIKKTDGETLQIQNSENARLTFDGDNALFTAQDGRVLTIGRENIVSIVPVPSVADEYSVTYVGASATVVNPYPLRGVTTEIYGARVKVVNDNVADEFTFVLTGTSTNGDFTYNGGFKCKLRLCDLNLTSTSGAAIDIKCGKRIAVEVTGENILTDCAGGEQKACMYFKGHPEFTGSGTLSIMGCTAHALSTNEYLQLKKSFGTLNILGATKDGIHAGQYFQCNGGTVTVRNVTGDGIQVEATSKPEDENNGQMIIKGGTIDISVTDDEADCLKADSLITISGGNIKLQAAGATSKAIKGKADVMISAGEINAIVTGNGIVVATAAQAPGGGGHGGGWPGGWDKEDQETSSAGCIKVDGNLTLTGGTLTLKATGKGGKCINVDGWAVIGNETDGPIISASTTGGVVTGSGENINGLPKAIKVYGDLLISNGTITASTTQNGGEGIECKSRLTVDGGVILCDTYDDGINSATKITINGGLVCCRASNNDGMDCNGSEGFEFNGGVILSSGARSPEEGFDCDNYKFVINGGTIIGTGGASSGVTSAKQPFASVSSQSITADQYLSLCRADGSVICSYKVPNTITGVIVVSSPEFSNGTQYKLVRNSSAVLSPETTSLDGIFTTGGTLQGGTSTNITPKTK